jgi:hypothetical protein
MKITVKRRIVIPKKFARISPEYSESISPSVFRYPVITNLNSPQFL